MKEKFDPTKPVQFRNGDEVRILVSDLKSDYPVVAVSRAGQSSEYVVVRRPDGQLYGDRISDVDLINISTKKEREAWILFSITSHRIFGPFFSKTLAEERVFELEEESFKGNYILSHIEWEE